MTREENIQEAKRIIGVYETFRCSSVIPDELINTIQSLLWIIEHDDEMIQYLKTYAEDYYRDCCF
jgi:hypothetical protein